ncbi:phosphomannomutase/phosphoglucomutase [Aneurinibacillus thermoaerophilus]|uniref:phosphomannomutase/phosphoglucomutase n=1 Tax=Aneurinibacillus thermoaerophilus TaxID=143495 RepID=UPI002E246858|nr:phosphomannomutase/phosphoglucomutase [Aneurinibacillus thermoaerophilus]MED0736179.1 phosphomannomutase/phosphoglucomutase [Aneurinibacillus thermoaerophilus]MED0766135.1 phosphomannomutase/phosphoglucomutase [Aneurinibacillus thermoaerophilus]
MSVVSENAVMPAHVFREYDIRGKAGADIDQRFAYLLGRAFGDKVKKRGVSQAVVARDNRTSSLELHRALISGLHRSGCEVIDVGEVTTPMFYYALEHFNISCGVIITASHNPGDENGFKIAMDKTTIYGSAIQQLKTVMKELNASEAIPDSFDWDKNLLKPRDIETPYLHMLREKIKLGPRKLKVVADCGNGTPSPFVPKALKAWGCDVIPLYCESDPSFPNHHPDPVDPKNLQDLISKVKEEQADLGIAFDGDGDRLGVVDEKGHILWGDQLMILFWREILPKYPGCEALVEVKCSQGLVEEIERLGGKPVFHRTGHSHIKATMKRINTPFTGEMSGHLFFRDEYYGFDDALYAAGRLLRILSHSERRLSDLFSDVPQYFSTPETRVPCEEGQKQPVLEQVKRHFSGKHDIIDVDGVRVLFGDGWGLIRSSNTQPILVLRAEAESEQGLKRIKQKMEKALHAACSDLVISW